MQQHLTMSQARARLLPGCLAGLLLIQVLGPGSVSAEVYKTVDANGKVTYTDQPTEPAERVNIAEPNSMLSVEKPKTPEASQTATEEDENKKAAEPYRYIAITSPEDDAVIPHGPGNFSVSVSTEPALQKGHRLVLNMDGVALQRSTSGEFQLTNVARGTHSLSAQVVDANGRALASSKTIKVNVFRPIAGK